MISNQILSRIRNIQKSLSVLESLFTEKATLTLNEAMLLFCLEQNGKSCSGSTAKHMGQTHSNASKILCLLESKQLIERSLGSTDRRQMYFELTPEGSQKLEQIKAILNTNEEPLKTILGGGK